MNNKEKYERVEELKEIASDYNDAIQKALDGNKLALARRLLEGMRTLTHETRAIRDDFESQLKKKGLL